MNLKPGGKQAIIHDTYWKGKLQCMVFSNGTPKALKNDVIERGIKIHGMKFDDMQKEITPHLYFFDKLPKTFC